MIGAMGGAAAANSGGGSSYYGSSGSGSGWWAGLKVVGTIVGLGLAGFGIHSCSGRQERSKLDALTPLVDTRLAFFTEELASLKKPAVEFRAAAGDARREADQPLLNQLEKCSHSLALLRNMLETRLDRSMNVDFAVYSPKVNYNDFPLRTEIPRGSEYLNQLAACREACMRNFKETAVALENDAGHANRECAALLADAHRSLGVLSEHVSDRSLSFDQQFITVDKFGTKRVVGVSDPFFEAESSVRLLQAALRS